MVLTIVHFYDKVCHNTPVNVLFDDREPSVIVEATLAPKPDDGTLGI